MQFIFKSIVGSLAYGTNTPESDVDVKGIYIQPVNDIVGFKYIPQLEPSKDEVHYEIKRLLELAQTANPTILELLYSPEDCILLSSTQYNILKSYRELFLTKKCRNSFGGYAVQQIKKAKGLDKKLNWEKDRVDKKEPLDFVYIYLQDGPKVIKDWLESLGKSQEDFGLAKVPHFPNCYNLYLDWSGERIFRGISFEKSTDIRLSSIPKGYTPYGLVHYNKEGYSRHCKEYKEYQTWLKERNVSRYTDFKGHDQQYDGKNLLHCRRLLDMAKEIATEGILSVRRSNAEYLLKIRRGEVKLDEIIDKAEEDILKLDELYEKSSLPSDCNRDTVHDILMEIRND